MLQSLLVNWTSAFCSLIRVFVKSVNFVFVYGGKGVVNVEFVGKLLRRVTTETEDSITVPCNCF